MLPDLGEGHSADPPCVIAGSPDPGRDGSLRDRQRHQPTLRDERARLLWRLLGWHQYVGPSTEQSGAQANLAALCLSAVNKLDYIQGMGFDAVWISPISQQVTNASAAGQAYHSYWPTSASLALELARVAQTLSPWACSHGPCCALEKTPRLTVVLRAFSLQTCSAFPTRLPP